MNFEEHDTEVLEAQAADTRAMLADLPADCVLERLGFESILGRIEAELTRRAARFDSAMAENAAALSATTDPEHERAFDLHVAAVIPPHGKRRIGA